MVSNIRAGGSAYLQNMQDIKDKKGAEPVKKSKELDKVDTIKEQIKSGNYKLDMEKTAKSILDELV
ncbi:MAG: flagellar biosynthesis anti-sigma factor FlgM [Sulfurospirillum sp.]